MQADDSSFQKYKVYADIHQGGDVKRQWVVEDGNFDRFNQLFVRQLQTGYLEYVAYMQDIQPLDYFSVIPKWMTWMALNTISR